MTANPQVSELAKVTPASVLIAVMLGTLLSVVAISGFIYLLIRSGRLPVMAAPTVKASQVTPQSTHSVILEPLLVNLADRGGNAYLRIGLTLQVTDKAEVKTKQDHEGKKDPEKEATAVLRDTALSVLGQQTANDLLASEGKEHLKGELRRALTERNVEINVTDIYFTEFLVQR